MNANSETLAATPAGTEATSAARAVLVWDAPVRLFHWLMVASFAGAYLTGESDRWRLLHLTLGWTLAGLVVFRLVWGLVGTRHARFASFVRGPAAVWRYVRALASGHPEHHVGHNPAGALAIVALLALSAVVVASGWATFEGLGGEWLESMHEGAAQLMLAVVGVHVAGVLLGSWTSHENLVRAMVTGRKRGLPADGVRHAWRSVAALMLMAVCAFWALQWQSAPVGGERVLAAAAEHAAAHPGRHDDDD